MNIYRLYADNGNQAGFWVQHRTWTNVCCCIQSIAGQTFGKLPAFAPLQIPPEVVVRGFDVRSGRPVNIGPVLDNPENQNYSRIAKPPWHRDSKKVTE